MDDDTILDGTPTSLVPKLGEFPVSASAYYKQLFVTDNTRAGDAEGRPLEAAIDPFTAESNAFSTLPSTGVLLTFEQGWRQEGLALGELRHSLCLAPGEVTRVAVVDWRRDTSARSSAETTQDERVAARSDGAQAMQSVQQAVASEVRSGFALSRTDASQTQAAASGGGLLFSASGSAAASSTLGLSASSSQGSREIASEAATNVQRRTLEMSSATRSRRATQIQEVSERESQRTTTRVVANYNHMHALTLQYYEVLQVYALETRAIKAERCVFVPMAVQAFSPETMRDKPELIEALRRVLVEFGATELASMLDQFELSDEEQDHSLAELENRLLELQSDLRDARRALSVAVDATLEAWPSVVTRAVQEREITSEEAANFGPPSRLDVDAFHRKAAALPNIDAAERVLLTLLPPTMSEEQVKGMAEIMNEEVDGDYAALLGDLIAVGHSVRTQKAALETKRVALEHRRRLWPVLQEHALFLNQQMWMRIDQHHWHRMLAGRTYPDGEFDGHPLGGLVDPAPIGHFGNFVAFRWDFPRGADKERRAFEREYVSRGRRSNKDRDELQARVVLPTEGVFAEAVLGQSNSAEKIDISRFWNWQDSPIPILPPEMSPVGTDSRARGADTATLDFAEALATLRGRFDSLDAAPDDAIVEALTASLFGEGTDAAAAAAGAAAAGANAASGAASAQRTTVELQKNVQEFVVGLANSEVGQIAAKAVAAKGGGITSVGGLVNAARSGGGGGRAPAPGDSGTG